MVSELIRGRCHSLLALLEKSVTLTHSQTNFVRPSQDSGAPRQAPSDAIALEVHPGMFSLAPITALLRQHRISFVFSANSVLVQTTTSSANWALVSVQVFPSLRVIVQVSYLMILQSHLS